MYIYFSERASFRINYSNWTMLMEVTLVSSKDLFPDLISLYNFNFPQKVQETAISQTKEVWSVVSTLVGQLQSKLLSKV